MKCTGKQWKEFYLNEELWPDGVWHEDESVTINGQVVGDEFNLEAVADTDVVNVSGGIVLGINEGKEPSLETYLKRWLKMQSTISIVFDIPKEKEKIVRDAVKAALALKTH